MKWLEKTERAFWLAELKKSVLVKNQEVFAAFLKFSSFR